MEYSLPRTSPRTFPMAPAALRLGTGLAGIALLFTGVATPAAAQVAAPAWPSKPVRIIIPTPAGGNPDFVARPIMQKMAEQLRQPFVIENRPGAAGTIGVDFVVRAPADGYTMLFGAVGHVATSSALYAKLPYDALRDLIPVTNLADAPFALFVHPSLPVKSVKELITLARKRPGEITYASFGIGSYPHFATEALNAMVGMRMNHVPYKGSAPAATALLSGEVMAGLDAPQSTLPHLRSGRLRALAMGSTQRISIAPEIPTFAEAGLPGYTASAWFGLFLPAGTSKAIVDATHREGVRALQLPEIREPLLKAGFQVIGSTPEQFAQQVREDIARFTKIAREAGIKAE